MKDISHAINVSHIVDKICKKLGIRDPGRSLFKTAGLLHDIGKMCVPTPLLDKPEALTSDEYKVIQCHVSIGYHLLNNMPDRIHKVAAQAALYHHERLDGSGYLKLYDEKIPYVARIIAVADVYDALVSDRPYRDAWKIDDVKEYIREQAGEKLDMEIVMALLAVV